VSGDEPHGVPPGYARAAIYHAHAVCLTEAVRAIAHAVAEAGTLYAYAERHPERLAFAGRAPTYARRCRRVRGAWWCGTRGTAACCAASRATSTCRPPERRASCG
jgi:hypothetical protein